MKKVTIAFDVDGTLIASGEAKGVIKPNPRVIELLKAMASMKNTYIIAWSGQGEKWVSEVLNKLDLTIYVNRVTTKNYLGKSADGRHMFKPEIVPDIAIDDIQDCTLGKLNLIVREK